MSPDAVLVDAGPLVALITKSDEHHVVCCGVFDELSGPAYTRWPVITEAVWLLRKSTVAVDALLRYLESGAVQILELDPGAIMRIREIMDRYATLRLQLADAALLHLSEREGIDTVFTVDRRDFSIVRKHDGQPLHLLPSIG